ncbi:MAG: metallophosphoesterase, partial [Rhizobiaceae bacterium]|nr:metallophosphoesterase [Rhizobiaceae bacterium]
MAHAGSPCSRQAATLISRRGFMAGGVAAGLCRPALVSAADDALSFAFISDVHACLTSRGLAPDCQAQGKTDENLKRHVHALNLLPERHWPKSVGGSASGLPSAGARIGPLRGIVVGGDMTDDGGGQTAEPEEGPQIRQFSRRYRQGEGPVSVHFPVYAGLGNHDLDQDGRPPDVDWYRNELRDYVRLNHDPSAFFKASVPATNFDSLSDCYSWDWGAVHFVQLNRFGGDTRKGAADSLPWLVSDLAASAQGGRPVVLFQHYGWDPFSEERWDPSRTTFDDEGGGDPHWWSDAERRALVDAVSGYNVVALFHGHEHETPMIYRRDGLDVVKPKAAFRGGFALARIDANAFEVVL